jgi:hypothetical protein
MVDSSRDFNGYYIAVDLALLISTLLQCPTKPLLLSMQRIFVSCLYRIVPTYQLSLICTGHAGFAVSSIYLLSDNFDDQVKRHRRW